MLPWGCMQHGRDHDERQQKNGTRLDQQLTRDDEGVTEEFTRQARASDPAPTRKAIEEERARHAAAGTVGGKATERGK